MFGGKAPSRLAAQKSRLHAHLGPMPKWNCDSAADLLCLFNSRFPLPNKASWTVYQVSSDISMRVISALRHKHLTLAEWRRLPQHGRSIGPIGPAMSNLWDWTLSYRTNPTKTESLHLQASPPESERGSTASESKSELEQFLRQSQPLARRVPWPSAPILRNNTDRTS